MSWTEIKELAQKHERAGWAGIILQTDQVLAIEDELLSPVRDLARQAIYAWLDHDLNRLRQILDRLAHYGLEPDLSADNSSTLSVDNPPYSPCQRSNAHPNQP